jgi:hypothetical protein
LAQRGVAAFDLRQERGHLDRAVGERLGHVADLARANGKTFARFVELGGEEVAGLFELVPRLPASFDRARGLLGGGFGLGLQRFLARDRGLEASKRSWFVRASVFAESRVRTATSRSFSASLVLRV